jgi:hypothetical protein
MPDILVDNGPFRPLNCGPCKTAPGLQQRAPVQRWLAELALLEDQALQLRNSNQDRKWDELSTLLQETPVMRDAEGSYFTPGLHGLVPLVSRQ